MAEAEKTLRLFAPFMEKQPFAFSHMLEAVDFFQRGPTEIVIVGESGTSQMREWLKGLGRIYIPNRAIFARDPKEADGPSVPEAAAGKMQIDGRITAYVCRDRMCSSPITSLEELKAVLNAG
jgi:uncharacterized protein YyaL (SSP411 family)